MQYTAEMKTGGVFESPTIEGLIQDMAKYYSETDINEIDIKRIDRWDEEDNETLMSPFAVGYIAGQVGHVIDDIREGRIGWNKHINLESIPSLFI